MNLFKQTCFIFIVPILACGNKRSENKNVEHMTQDTLKTISIEHFYMDENEIHSNRWKEYKDETDTINEIKN